VDSRSGYIYISSNDGCVYRVNLLRTQDEGENFDDGQNEDIGDNLEHGDDQPDDGVGGPTDRERAPSPDDGEDKPMK